MDRSPTNSSAIPETPSMGTTPARNGSSLAATGTGEAAAAWTIYALMVLAALWFVVTYGLTMPYGDEWAWLPVVAGQQPVSLSWLWSLHNEHRMFLPRLIYLGLGKLTDFDFRAGTFYNLFILSGLSAALMLAARAIRGRSSIYDAFFPLAILHWAHYDNLLWGFQLNFCTSVVLAGMILLAIVRCGRQLTVPRAVFVTACLVALELCGLYGLTYLPALACWLAFAGVCRWRDGGQGGDSAGLSMIVMAGILLALVFAYVITFPCHSYRSPGIWAALCTTGQVLSGIIGPAGKEAWPVSALPVLAACGYASWQLFDVFRRRPDQRVRAAGFLCFFGGVGSLALAIGLARRRGATGRIRGSLRIARHAAALPVVSAIPSLQRADDQNPPPTNLRPADVRPAARQYAQGPEHRRRLGTRPRCGWRRTFGPACPPKPWQCGTAGFGIRARPKSSRKDWRCFGRHD